MITSGLVRYGFGLIVSVVFNLALVVGLAELGRPDDDADRHNAHAVAPSVVEPPPPETPSPSASPSPAAAQPIPSSPLAPTLDLPAPAALTDGPGLAWGALDGVGLGDLSRLGGDAVPSAAPDSTGPDTPPRMTVPPDLERFYPAAARERRLGGRTIVAVTVDRGGRVIAAQVLRSEPPGIFERAAERAARAFRFTPAQRGGRAIVAQTRLELKWQPRSSY